MTRVRQPLATVVDAVGVAVVRHRGRARELVALGVVDQLVIGHALLVQARTLLMELGLRPLGLRLALGDPRPLLGLVGLALARLGLGTVLAGHRPHDGAGARARASALGLVRACAGVTNATRAMMIRATTTMAMMAPVVIVNLLRWG